MKRVFLIICVGLLAWPMSAKTRAFVPPQGFVPDNVTAIAIAEAVLIPIYGRKATEAERPYVAKLQGSVWVVQGTVASGPNGGTATVRLSKSDGRILYVMHGK